MILSEAEAIIGAKGIDSLRLQAIADSLGIKVPAIYAHFKNREDILAVLADRYLSELATHYPYDASKSYDNQLWSGVRANVEFFIQHPAYTRLELRDLERPGGLPAITRTSGNAPDVDIAVGTTRGLRKRVDAMLAAGLSDGRYRKISAEDFIGFIRGIILVRLLWPKSLYEITDKLPRAKAEKAIIDSVVDFAQRIVWRD
jgi:AcrR family transcriptional regulator